MLIQFFKVIGREPVTGYRVTVTCLALWVPDINNCMCHAGTGSGHVIATSAFSYYYVSFSPTDTPFFGSPLIKETNRITHG